VKKRPSYKKRGGMLEVKKKLRGRRGGGGDPRKRPTQGEDGAACTGEEEKKAEKGATRNFKSGPRICQKQGDPYAKDHDPKRKKKKKKGPNHASEDASEMGKGKLLLQKNDL